MSEQVRFECDILLAYPSLQVQLAVAGPVLAHVENSGQPPLLARQALIGAHVALEADVTTYPGLQLQLFVPGPVMTHAALGPQTATSPRAQLSAAMQSVCGK